MEILETFPQVFCFPKSRINENGGNKCLTDIYLLEFLCLKLTSHVQLDPITRLCNRFCHHLQLPLTPEGNSK